MGRYLAKLPHVSAACRLSVSEEIAALRLCKQGPIAIRNRLEVLRGLEVKPGGPSSSSLGGDASTGGASGSASLVDLKGPAPRWGGQPWRKLCATGLGALETHAQRIKRVCLTHISCVHAMSGCVQNARVFYLAPIDDYDMFFIVILVRYSATFLFQSGTLQATGHLDSSRRKSETRARP